MFILQTNSGLEFLMIIPGNSLYFPAVDFLRTKVCKISVKDDYSHLPVVIDCRHILGADFTAAKVRFTNIVSINLYFHYVK